ncbi:LicD family protein [Candidatus Cloacimonadota bacterium]
MAGSNKLEGKNVDIALKLLHDVTLELERSSIPYWLEGGTLLGVIRENRLLPWDNDMDISMYKTDQKKIIPTLLRLLFKGYRISVKKYRRNIGPFKKGELRMIKIRNYEPFLRKGKVMLDIFLKRKLGNEYFWTVGVKSPVLKSAPASFYDVLTWVDFNNKKYMISKDYDGYLTYRYGDWKIQVKTWNFKKDDKAIVTDKGI